MFDFSPADTLEPAERYRQLADAADALTQGEPDTVANMANLAALLWEFVPGSPWGGEIGERRCGGKCFAQQHACTGWQCA